MNLAVRVGVDSGLRLVEIRLNIGILRQRRRQGEPRSTEPSVMSDQNEEQRSQRDDEPTPLRKFETHNLNLRNAI